jgi:hypothetical protein
MMTMQGLRGPDRFERALSPGCLLMLGAVQAALLRGQGAGALFTAGVFTLLAC